MTRRGRALALLFAGAITSVGIVPAGRALLWRWELNPVLRGRLLAESQGCLDCHRPDAGPEAPNPGSRWGSVPRFQAGNAFMYGPSRAEIEEFIRLGALRAWTEDPEGRKRLADQRIRMPAYGDRLSDSQVADLVAYVAALEGVEPPGGDRAGEGRRIAREQGCLSCHAIEGSGGLANPGSLGGFVPGLVLNSLSPPASMRYSTVPPRSDTATV